MITTGPDGITANIFLKLQYRLKSNLVDVVFPGDIHIFTLLNHLALTYFSRRKTAKKYRKTQEKRS